MIDCANDNKSKLVRKLTNRQITVDRMNKSVSLDTIATQKKKKKKKHSFQLGNCVFFASFPFHVLLTSLFLSFFLDFFCCFFSLLFLLREDKRLKLHVTINRQHAPRSSTSCIQVKNIIQLD